MKVKLPMIFGVWKSVEDVNHSFSYHDPPLQELVHKDELLFAGYWCEYDGHAFVLFRRRGRLYEVNGSHCSCMGLEGQWEPEETTKKALLYRLDHGTLGVRLCVDYTAELRSVLSFIRVRKPK